jgi:flagellar biosynthesis/type III secretory pathway protein FliH
MKFSFAAVSAALTIASVDAFVPQTHSHTNARPGSNPDSVRTVSSALRAEESHASSFWWGPVATAFAGVSLVARIAVAAPEPTWTTGAADDLLPQTSSVLIADRIDSMDFSMPSYSDAIKSATLDTSASSSSKPAPPSFNPFEDSSKDDAASAAAKAEEKAAAEAKKAEDKARAELEAATKKAEKEARRQAELEKQKAAAERTKAAQEEKAAAPASSSVELPSVPSVDLKLPDISIPDFKAPDITIPDFKAPDIKMPDLPKFSMPKMATDGYDFPDIKAPKVDIPNVDMPKIAMPALPSFGGGGGASSSDNPSSPLESQDVRDERARSAKADFADADNTAREIEAKALELRAVANDKKQAFKDAKDEACATRPGGKILCLRNPMKAGF